MSSPIRPVQRDEAPVHSPFRNAFASSSKSPAHSPFLVRRSRPSPSQLTDSISRPATAVDAISTSSSTLVNADNLSDYRPWEVRTESSASSLASATVSGAGRALSSLSGLEEPETLASIRITPLPNRRTRLDGSTSADKRKGRHLCPVDCRCSDPEVDLESCRRVVGSSSSGSASEAGSLSVGVHAMAPRTATPQPSMDDSRHSSEPKSQGRDFDKDPVLVPRSSRRSTPRSANGSYQRSYDQLQLGLDTLDRDDSDADSDADQASAAQRRAESMARWTARRTSMEKQSQQSPLQKAEPTSAPSSQPTGSPKRSDVSFTRRTPGVRQQNDSANADTLTPLKATPGRKSIAAVFESMQKEREMRAAEEHKQWQEKQARRERERAARAFGMPNRRRTSASSSQFDSPVSASSIIDTTAREETPSKSSPVVSLTASPSSPKIDDPAPTDVEPRHLGEEAAGRIPETLSEEPEIDVVQQSDEDQVQVLQRKVDSPSSPSPFAFSSQPMAVDLSPIRSVSDFSSPASSPRKNAHRRQNTNTVSVATQLPPASLGAARERLNRVLAEVQDTPQRVKSEQEKDKEQDNRVYAQTPVMGILSSAKKASLLGRRGNHSVRFSPKPDYRSDSGSWDESTTQQIVADADESRDAAVERLLLPANEITIPDVLASASTPLIAAPSPKKQKVESPAKVEQIESPSRPHTLVPPLAPHLAHPSSNDSEAAASFSQSVRFPGAYTGTPIKAAEPSKSSYSRHVIKPSPRKRLPLPSPYPHSPSTPAEFGLFPVTAGADMPRSSTPPLSKGFLPPDDPRNSPRSPRPANLGSDHLGRFHAADSASNDEAEEDDSGGELARENMRVNERRTSADDSVNTTIGKLLKNIEVSHSARIQRASLGEKLNQVSERVKDVGRMEVDVPRTKVASSWTEQERAVMEEVEEDRVKMDELRAEVLRALQVLADRIGQLQTTNSAPGDVSSVSTSPSVASIVSRPKKGLPKWAIALLVMAQCTLMAYLMALAERKAQHGRMYSPALDHRLLYHPSSSSSSSGIEWNSVAHDIHLTPLLAIPGLSHLSRAYPPLPAPSMLSLLKQSPSPSTLLDLYTSYVKLNGLPAFALQLAVYALSQLVSCLLLLLLAPLQVVWILIQPGRF